MPCIALIINTGNQYQAQHRDRFLTKKGQWINAKQLTVNKTTRNRFWAGTRQALERDTIRCLFVTRSDTMGGKLVSPQDGSEQPVILNPNSGWEALKNRLVNDLAYQRRILFQVDVVDAETLRAAQQRPEEHQDLMVRVAGYSARFVDLSAAMQEEFISRTEQSELR